MTNFSEIKAAAQNWWVVLIQGILFICLGLVFAFNPAETLIWAVQLLALYWILSGAFSIAGSILGGTEGSRLWTFLAGLIGMFAGTVMIAVPLIAAALTATFWMYFMGFASVIYGVALLFGEAAAEGESESSDSSRGHFVLGILNVLFGALLVAFPLVAAGAYVIFAGVFAVFGGIALVVFAFRLRGISAGPDPKPKVVAHHDKQPKAL